MLHAGGDYLAGSLGAASIGLVSAAWAIHVAERDDGAHTV